MKEYEVTMRFPVIVAEDEGEEDVLDLVKEKYGGFEYHSNSAKRVYGKDLREIPSVQELQKELEGQRFDTLTAIGAAHTIHYMLKTRYAS